MGLKLFDGDDDVNDISKIEINEEYARRYEHNKKREDLHRLQELQKKGVIGDSSSSDSDDSSDEDSDEVRPSKKDMQFFDVLIKVKNQDPSLKQKDVSLFESDEESDGEGESKDKSKKKQKKMYLKDVVAKQLIEKGPEFDEDNDADEGDVPREEGYLEKQVKFKNDFLQAWEAADDDDDDDGGDGFFTLKKKDEDVEVGSGDDGELQKKLNEYFGDALDENNKFLRDYFLKKMWIDKDEKKKGLVDVEELDELLEDEEAVEKQEDYETNYRHEELEDDRVLGHSRTVEGSVRQKETARKRQRQSKEERMKIAEMERKEELKHLKNLKKEEIKEKLNKFKKIAGIADEEDVLLQEDDLDDEFDPEEYDTMMKKVFDEKYYGAKDVDPEFGSDGDEDVDIEKPDFEKEDELLGLPKGWDDSGTDGFQAAREKMLKEKAEAGDDSGNDGGNSAGEDDENGDGVDGGVEATEEGSRKRKRKLSLVKKAKEALMEEYYNLDYEGTIGDLKTRFKYAKVKPNRYGLSAAEILMTDDKELNQYVSLKRIAPFREEWKVPYGQRCEFKTKKNQPLGEGPSMKRKGKRPRVDAVGDGKASADAVDGDASKLSRKARRRMNQAELKLSHRRLLAYGKMSSKKSKGKSKK